MLGRNCRREVHGVASDGHGEAEGEEEEGKEERIPTPKPVELRLTLVCRPTARGSSFGGGGGEETNKAGTEIVQGEVGRDWREGGRECRRILVVPHDVYLRLPDPSLQEAVSPKGPKGGEGIGALIVPTTDPIPSELPARRKDRPQRFGQGGMLRDPAETA